jgi:hypothetical protein
MTAPIHTLNSINMARDAASKDIPNWRTSMGTHLVIKGWNMIIPQSVFQNAANMFQTVVVLTFRRSNSPNPVKRIASSR